VCKSKRKVSGGRAILAVGLRVVELDALYGVYHSGVLLATAGIWLFMIYLWSAFWTAGASLAFAFWAQGFLSATILRGAVGLGLAGTYMPGMRMVAERFASGGRGFAMGCYIGSFTLGTSVSLLLTGWANGLWGWRWAFALTAAGPLVAGLIGWLVLPRGMAAAPKAKAKAKKKLEVAEAAAYAARNLVPE
jgi:MFS family permease